MYKIIRQSYRPLVVFLTAILGIMIWIFFSKKTSSSVEKDFYKQSFTTKVTGYRYYYHRSIEFQLKNGVRLYFMPSDEKKLEVEDSISKNGNTFLYTVYRKDIDGKYHVFGVYDYQSMP